MFEYRVKCRHKLGWNEIKLYADTDIEEFFNRNGIDYVRNMTDTVEHRQLKENERLNNIINEFDDFITNVDSHINLGDESEEFILVRDKWLELQELKGSDKE